MNVKNLVLGIGIFIVYILALVYGIEAFYHSPKYDDFCHARYDKSFPYPASERTLNCTNTQIIENQNQECYNSEGFPNYEYDEQGCVKTVICNYCNRDLNNAQKEYAKWVFVIALIIGIATLLVGYLILSIEPVGSALIASGIGSIFYGSVRNWANLQDVWRFLLLFACLVLLIWIALRLNRKKRSG